VSVEVVCREHCEAYRPETGGFTSVLDYEQCLFDCEQLYMLLRELAELIKNRCENEAKERPARVRERFTKACIGHDLGMIAYNPELVEKLLRLIASEAGVRL
jgi:hypothetical protein